MRSVVAGGLALLLMGCTTPEPAPPPPAPTQSTPAPDTFTVITTVMPTTLDPAAATTAADAIVALNAFSRLMLVQPTDGELKPDLAEDCLFTSPTTYQCSLPEGLTFANEHKLTSSDVKFSIERAYRLYVEQTGVQMLDSLDRIVTPDDRTINFELKWPDSQFGYSLALPVASIVDEELYDPDALRPAEGLPAGSGPYTVVTLAEEHLVFDRDPGYVGGVRPTLEEVTLRSVADSAAAEATMADGTADVVWQALDSAARARATIGPAPATTATPARGYAAIRLPEAHVERLWFHPASAWWVNQDVRKAVAMALQGDRTLASLIPPGVSGSATTFPVGGNPDPVDVSERRPRLRLSYASKIPDQRDRAAVIRDRLEAKAGMSVQLVPDTADADLTLSVRPAWVNTAFGWLQAYTAQPLPESADQLSTWLTAASGTTDPEERQELLTSIQEQAALDVTVLPQTITDEIVFVGDGVSLQGEAFGPGWQLGFWGFRA
ncbi:MAG: ABC transporter substrate-binding protein [Propioniciclava sp.]